MKLYEITGKYGLLMERLEEEGTDIEEVLSLFDDLKEDLKDKADGYGRVRANYKAQIDAWKKSLRTWNSGSSMPCSLWTRNGSIRTCSRSASSAMAVLLLSSSQSRTRSRRNI